MAAGEIRGTVADGFEQVREEFAAVLAEEPGEPGAQLAAYVHGRQVVDLWAGEDLTGDSLTGVFSSGKGAAYLVVALLVQEEILALDDTVAGYWPEFAAEGKGDITLRQLLAHRAGVVGVDGGFSPDELADDRLIAARLAAQRPFWRPGTAYGYHCFGIGALLGEVVRRVTGSSLQQVYEERIRRPYELDLYLGLPDSLEHRYATMRPWLATPEQQAVVDANWPKLDTIAGIAYNLNATPPTDQVRFINTREVRALGQASAGGVGNARGLAELYAAAVGEFRGRPPLLKPDTVAEFATLSSTGADLVTGAQDRFALGFEAKGARYPFLGPDAFGHSGSAGSEAFADPRSGVTYGYTRRRFAFFFSAPENDRLAAAVLRAAGRQ